MSLVVVQKRYPTIDDGTAQQPRQKIQPTQVKVVPAKKYTITFPKGKTPPAGAFWSVTLYDAKKRLMVENSLNRYKIGSADKLKSASDGSTTLYIQADSPGKDKESNWRPAPKAPFYTLMRMYLPKIEVLNGQYEIPGVERAR